MYDTLQQRISNNIDAIMCSSTPTVIIVQMTIKRNLNTLNCSQMFYRGTTQSQCPIDTSDPVFRYNTLKLLFTAVKFAVIF